MRISVVINTYNRGESLRRTLQSLRHQTHDPFEVVVVNGPSTDQTPAVLREFAGAVRVGNCPEVHLSKSRNVGIALAAGEVVAFLDDDAVPEPLWLEQLATAYDDPHVGGAGGIVHDHTGFHLQYRYAASDRLGRPRFDVTPPFDALCRPGADPFVYLQGTNCSFRRDCLVEMGGFDEEIEYFLDETEVCLQMVDRGHVLRPLANAAVHHKYLASHLRTPRRVVLDPYPFAKNRSYFALRHGRRSRVLSEVLGALDAYADELRRQCEQDFAAGRMDAGQRATFLARLEQGLRDGKGRGLAGARRSRSLGPADPGQFFPFPALRPAGGQLRVCLVGWDGPPVGGLAATLAGAGHEVHVVTGSQDSSRVDFEGGLWLHRLAPPERWLPELGGADPEGRLARAAAAYHEARRLYQRGPLDAIVAPQGAGESLVCTLDAERFPVVLTPPALTADEGAAHFYRAATRAAQRPTDPGEPAQGADPVPARLARALVEGTGLSPAAAERTAARLLDPACHPVDHRAVVLRLLRAPPEVYLTGLYHLLFNRDPDRLGLDNYLARLRNGTPRAVLVREMALSEEARRLGVPVGWLNGLGRGPCYRHLPQRAWGLLKRLAWAVRGRRAPPPCGASKEGAEMSRLARLGRLLRAAVSPKNVARYVKRLLYLPWNFQKVFDEFQNLQVGVSQQTQCLRQTEQALVLLMRELQENQAALERRTAEVLQTLSAELREAAARMQQEMRQVKSRYAEFYGALAEGLKEQNRFTEDIARSLEGVRAALAEGPGGSHGTAAQTGRAA
jgi:glycosyltransferase involved in cell wall biosynthesis